MVLQKVNVIRKLVNKKIGIKILCLFFLYSCFYFIDFVMKNNLVSFDIKYELFDL